MPLFFLFEILMVTIPKEGFFFRHNRIKQCLFRSVNYIGDILAFFLKLLHMCKFSTKTYVAI